MQLVTISMEDSTMEEVLMARKERGTDKILTLPRLRSRLQCSKPQAEKKPFCIR